MVQVAKLCCLTIITVPVLVGRSLSQDGIDLALVGEGFSS